MRRLFVFAAIGLASLSAGADVINIDFNGLRPGDTQGPTFSGAGAAGGGNVFNSIVADSTAGNDNLTVAGSNLVTSTGSATAAAFTIGLVGGDNNGAGAVAGNSAALLFDYVFNHSAGNNANAAFTISGLAPSSPATLYFYTSQSLPTLTVDNGTKVTYTPAGAFTTGNTVEFTVTTSAAGTITGGLGAGTNVLSGISVNAAVPEPAGLCLLGLGGLGLLARRRRA